MSGGRISLIFSHTHNLEVNLNAIIDPSVDIDRAVTLYNGFHYPMQQTVRGGRWQIVQDAFLGLPVALLVSHDDLIHQTLS